MTRIHGSWRGIGLAFMTLVAAQAAVAGLVLEKVWPEKLLYAPNEPALVTVTLKNTGTAEAKARLMVELRSGMDSQRELLNSDVAVLPGAKQEVPVRFTADGQHLGWEARAELWTGTNRLSLVKEWFTVSDDPWRVAHYSGFMWTYGLDANYVVQGYGRNMYSCVLESSAAGPAFLGRFIPDREEWIGCGGYREKKSTLKEIIRKSHEQGIRVLAYTWGQDFGPDGFDFARKHPEWVRRRPSGDWTADYNVEILDRTEDDNFPYRTRPEGEALINKKQFFNFWYPIEWDWQNEAVVKQHAAELIRTMKEVDYDGFRYDYFIANPPCPDIRGNMPKTPMTLDACGARNYEIVFKTVRKAFPKVLFGQNFGIRLEATSFNTPEQKAWKTICPGNYMLFEETVALWSPDHVFHNWEYYRKTVKEQGRHVLDNGGYYFIHLCRACVIQSPLAYEYQAATAFAARAHLGALTEVGGAAYAGVGMPVINAFALRFADQVFDPALRDLPTNAVNVAGGELWWKEYGYTHSSQGREEWVLHLINPPASNTPDPAMKETRPPVKDVRVKLARADGKLPAKAWYLSPDGASGATGGAEWVTPLAISGDTVTVPEVKVWGMVCVEW